MADLGEMQLRGNSEGQSLSIDTLCKLFGAANQPDNKIIAELYTFLEIEFGFSSNSATLPSERVWRSGTA